MASIRDLAVSRGQTVHFLRRSQIQIDPTLNIRDLTTSDNVAHIADIAAQIEARGFDSNLVIFMRDDKPFVWRGHCRLAAIDLLISRNKWDDQINLVPTLMRPAGVGLLEMIAEQSRNGDSKALNQREAAANLLRIMGMVGQSIERTAQLVGKSPSSVRQALSFNETATEEVHQAIASGKISATEAAKVVRRKGADAGVTITKMIETAAASGKRKATARHTAREPTFSIRDVRDPVCSGSLWAVTIDGKIYRFSEKFWTGLANAILDKAHTAEIAQHKVAAE